ncbi:hypothetical protein MON38_16025 [Hymenobacter sp. DH14]|uniref:Lipoprotein n=1 Tax=Hymenobacter cyanobacteriorum TaxID=2926463 RepID=A0A9X2AG70_9BACT|nr:hypothetical protein [Hymenobacter cyanobacteriorum]MCI1188931.1 hypothetical protein [Hymenobacter cyanobacteriorum]
MKIHLRFIIGLLLLALPLLGLKCSKEEIIKATEFDITVRVTGEHLDGLGAEMKVTSVRNVLNPSAGPVLTQSFGPTVSQTYSLGKFGLQDQVTAFIYFTNVTCTSVVQPAANTSLLVEVLANGVLVSQVRLKPGTTGGNFTCTPYWTNSDESHGDDWD